jgi:polyhydroxybutyrate depolymerase
MRSRSIRRGSALLLAAALIVGACSDDSSDDVSSDTVDEPAVESTTTTAGAADGQPVPSPGCGTSEAVAGVEQEVTLDIEGQPRRYLVTTPSAHDGETPLPLVLDFHGLMEGAEIHAEMSQYTPVAEEEGFVVAFPHGSGDPVRWDAEPGTDPNLDLVYFDTMVEQLGNDLCLDESRIYATGLSYGAIFTSLLLCERAEVLAAAAPVAGIADPEGCDPSQPVPILTFHGTEDPILLFNGGVNTSAIPGMGDPSAPTTTFPPPDLATGDYPDRVAAWAERNGCEPEPTDTEVTPEVIHRVFDCPEGADVEFYIILGGGHSWPSSEFSQSIGAIVGPTTFDVDGTRDSWAFLKQFQNPSAG